MIETVKKRRFIKTAAFLAFCLSSGCQDGKYEPLSGDIIFQDSGGLSSREIKIATNSPYSHCGIITVEGDNIYVIEAVGPVRKIPLDDWIRKGRGRYTVKRLIDKINSDNIIRAAENYMGLPYDKFYEWDDEKLYCSELVYKAYLNGADLSLSPMRKFKDYDIESIRESILDRYGKIPEELELVAPADLADSKLLKTVYSNIPE